MNHALNRYEYIILRYYALFILLYIYIKSHIKGRVRKIGVATVLYEINQTRTSQHDGFRQESASYNSIKPTIGPRQPNVDGNKLKFSQKSSPHR